MVQKSKQEVLLALAKMQEQSIYMDKTTKNYDLGKISKYFFA